MSEDPKNRSALIWIIVASGAALLFVTTAITVAFLVLPAGPVPFAMTKRIEAPTLSPVTGMVTLDGKPLKLAIVKFVPIVGSTTGSMLGCTSFGMTDADGKYTLTYAMDDDGTAVMGAVIGPHQVQIQLNDPSGEQLVPEKYGTPKSELKADVKEGMPPLDFALTSEPVEAPE